jgi:energy-coupling factor transporter ATP-binding protein EcfA2
MEPYISSINAIGVHEKFNIVHNFNENINIIHGKNGTGKSTLLHIIANILNKDFDIFRHLIFESINLKLSNGNSIEINRDKQEISINGSGIFEINQIIPLNVDPEKTHDLPVVEAVAREQYTRWSSPRHNLSKLKNNEKILNVAYFPAFRSILEALNSPTQRPARPSEIYNPNKLARKLYGSFVPNINFPSLGEIEEKVSRELEYNIWNISNQNNKFVNETIVEIFKLLPGLDHLDLSSEDHPSESIDNILNEIRAIISALKSDSIGLVPVITEKTYKELDELTERFIEKKGAKTKKLQKRILSAYRKFKQVS